LPWASDTPIFETVSVTRDECDLPPHRRLATRKTLRERRRSRKTDAASAGSGSNALARLASVAKDQKAGLSCGRRLVRLHDTTKARIAACAAIGTMGIPVLVIPGNHDHAGPGAYDAALFSSGAGRVGAQLESLAGGGTDRARRCHYLSLSTSASARNE